MPAPRSYTREDVLELHCHGGRAAARAVLDAALSTGVRLAGPGEFTLRAYLRGRIDLVQAEAVADVIRAETSECLKVHEALLEGRLSREIARWQDLLAEVLMRIEAYLDFPDEDLPEPERCGLSAPLAEVSEAMGRKLATFAWGRTSREGFRVAILGAPNVGKSSLLNRLAEEDRAMVSPIAGTTRDTIEVRINALGAPIHVTDTAGLRTSADALEEEGVRRARLAAEGADLLLLVFDGSRGPCEEELREAADLSARRPSLALINKCDSGTLGEAAVRKFLGSRLLFVSAETGEGVDELLRALRDAAWSGGDSRGEDALTRLRHRAAVEAAREAVDRARALLSAPEGFLDAAAGDLHEARRKLRELLGWGTPEDVLDRIFAEFCIGK
jgi:tRNA modification GTPase